MVISMNLQTISELSKAFQVSTRTLRYYEQIGLLSSTKKDGYAYRTYDMDAVRRLQQILVLRKLRIPLKQIRELLGDRDAVLAVEVFRQSMMEIDAEISALSTIRSILNTFVERLHLNIDRDIEVDLLSEGDLLSLVDTLSVTKSNFKEEKSMANLDQANQIVSQLRDSDVRILYLPPCTVASYQYVGDDPEMHTNQVTTEFVRSSNLTVIKPDLRLFGFNAPNPVDESGFHGYESWVTIPPDMEVPAPLVKKQFPGGLYAAHMIPFGAFEQWQWLIQWVTESKQYDYAGDWNNDIMFGWLEEHLNYFSFVNSDNQEEKDMQLDLLIPIKPKD